jgi:hypothetical protein
MASVRGWDITSGSFRGLRIGDGLAAVIHELRAVGVTTVFGDDPAFQFVSSVDDLPHLYLHSDFVIHPGSIRVTLEGDRVTSVLVPPGGRPSPYQLEIKKATTRADLFAVFAKILEDHRYEPLIERIDPEPRPVSIEQDDPSHTSELAAHEQWTAFVFDDGGCDWQYQLNFGANSKLASIHVVAGMSSERPHPRQSHR